MPKKAPRTRRVVLLWVGLRLALASGAGADLILINNGLAPPEPLNVVDASDAWADDELLIRNEGCGTELDPDAVCSSPGAQTRVEVTSGGVIDTARVLDFSAFDMSGGSITHDLFLFFGSNSTMTGGSIDAVAVAGTARFVLVDGTMRLVNSYDSGFVGVNGGSVEAFGASDTSTLRIFDGAAGSVVIGQGSATIELFGGAFEAALSVFDLATATICGTDFRVDGVPVPLGEIGATTGTLTGKFDAGDPIDLTFERDPTARIELMPEADGLLAELCALGACITMAQRRRRATVRIRLAPAATPGRA